MAQATTAELPTIVSVKRLATYGLLALVLTCLVNGAVRVLALAAFNVPLAFPLWWEAVLASSAVGAVGATVVYGVITRISTQPNRTFTLVAVIVLLLSFVGPVNAYLSPSADLVDAPWTVFAAMAVMHVTSAATIVGVLTRTTNRRKGHDK